MKQKTSTLAKVFCIIGILSALLIILMGFVTMGSYSGAWSDTSTSFGADFYTYSYKATARACNNVDELGDLVASASGWILVAAGLFQLCFFGVKLGTLPPKNPTFAAPGWEYQQPAYQQPAYQQPAYQQPAYQQPAYQQPEAQYAYPPEQNNPPYQDQ